MKKLISLLAALAVVTTGTAAFAADFTVETTTAEGTTATSTMTATGDEATVGAIEADADGLYTVDLATVAGDQDQTTILAVEGKTIKVGSIKYINQSDATSFTFGMDAPADTVYVLAGGSAINPTLVAKIEAKADEPETFTISGTVTGYVGTATIPAVVVSDGTNNYTATVNADGTFTVDVPVLESGSYTLTATKAGHLKYSKANITAAATVAPVLKAGDMNVDNIADVSDMALIVDNYGAMSTDTGFTASYDINEDNIMDVSDMALVVDNYGAMSISE